LINRVDFGDNIRKDFPDDREPGLLLPSRLPPGVYCLISARFFLRMPLPDLSSPSLRKLETR
jgi:hypothetical protein